MENWVISLLSAFGGAVAALIGRELIEWFKRPRLEIDFEERGREKPYIIDVNDYVAAAKGDSRGTYRIKHLRLKVQNKGKQAALNCEAKLSLASDSKNGQPADAKIIHWSRRDYLLYTKGFEVGNPITDSEKAYAPIDISRNDIEYIEVLRIPYWHTSLPNGEMPKNITPELESASVRAIGLVFHPNTEYQLKVTVYSKNASPVSKTFNFKWDGTLEGFNSEVITKQRSKFETL